MESIEYSIEATFDIENILNISTEEEFDESVNSGLCEQSHEEIFEELIEKYKIKLIGGVL